MSQNNKFLSIKASLDKPNRAHSKIISKNIQNISIILFVDGASLLKTGSKGSIWAMFSIILDLPPRLRVCFQNIITHFIIGAHDIDLNEFLSLHLNGLKKIQINDVDFNFDIQVNVIIADLPALAKSLNMNTFRGYYPCIQCLTKGENINKTMVFPYSKNTPLRTNELYDRQVDEAIRNKITYKGIKGKSFLSGVLRIPDNVLFDYMHLSCIGTMDHLLDLWLYEKTNSEGVKYAWYLSKKVFYL